MGHVINAKSSFRLGANIKWMSSWVNSGKEYKINFHNDLLILRLIRNTFNNYGNPDFSPDVLKNNTKSAESGERNINKNQFVKASLTYSHTRIAPGINFAMLFDMYQLVSANRTASLIRKNHFLCYLKSVKSIKDFSLKILGCTTRKNVLTRHNVCNVRLVNKSANIEYATQGINLRFGMTNANLHIMKTDAGVKPMAYQLTLSLLPLFTKIKEKYNDLQTYVKTKYQTKIFNLMSMGQITGFEEPQVIWVVCLIGGGFFLRHMYNAYRKKMLNIAEKAAANNITANQKISSSQLHTSITILDKQTTTLNVQKKNTDWNITKNSLLKPVKNIIDGIVISENYSPFVSESMEEKYWFFSKFPCRYQDLFITNKFFENFQNYEQLVEKKNLSLAFVNQYFILNLAATAMGLIEKNYDVAAVVLIHYFLFPRLQNRKDLQYLFANKKGNKIDKDYVTYNLFQYLNQELQENMNNECRLLLEKLNPNFMENLDECLGFTKIGVLGDNPYGFIEFLLKEFPCDPSEIKNHINKLTTNWCNQSKPDGYFVANNIRLSFDVKSGDDPKSTANFLLHRYVPILNKNLSIKICKKDRYFYCNYLRAKYSVEDLKLFLFTCTNHLDDNLVSLLNNESMPPHLEAIDVEKVVSYRNNLQILYDSYKNQEIGWDDYLVEFIKLYHQNLNWVVKYDLTINLPVIISLDDLDLNIPAIRLVITKFIEEFSNNFSEQSPLYKYMQKYYDSDSLKEPTDSYAFIREVLHNLYPTWFQ